MNILFQENLTLSQILLAFILKNGKLIRWAVFELKIKDDASLSGSARTPKNYAVILQGYVYLVGMGCDDQYFWSIVYDAPTCSEYKSEKISKIRWGIRCNASFLDGTLVI